MNRPKRILLGHLASFGDCLLATPIARQIKEDYPGCVLTWAVGSMYRPAIEGNPYVDEIWEIPLTNRNEMENIWRRFEPEAGRRVAEGEFDEMFLTQINPNNYQNFDGTIRASILRGYPRPITVPLTPVLRLRDDEVARVRRFAEEQGIARWKHVVLFECASRSGQSDVTPSYALDVARRVRERLGDCCFILSSNEKIDSREAGIVDASVLSPRENAELSKYCTMLVGCSSGITWVCTSDWAKKLPTIQVLKRSTSVYASMAHDALYFGLPDGHIIEMTDSPAQRLADCIREALTEPFESVRGRYHEQIPVELNLYLELFMRSELRKGRLLKVLKSLSLVRKRYGLDPFARYVKTKLAQLSGTPS
jgi:hypothetical protein